MDAKTEKKIFKCLTAELIFGRFSETYFGSIKLS